MAFAENIADPESRALPDPAERQRVCHSDGERHSFLDQTIKPAWDPLQHSKRTGKGGRRVPEWGDRSLANPEKHLLQIA